MMSNEGAPATSNLDGKRKMREKSGIQREEIGVVEGRKKRSAKRVQFQSENKF